jgi:hypothetical protein
MADLSLSTALSTLIGSIYDCVFDPSLWRETLAKMRDAINCRTATITLSDPRNARMLLDLSVGIEPSWIERAEQHAPEIHSRLTEYLASGPSLDAPHIISRHVTPAAYNESRYIQECLLPGGIVDVMLYFIMVEPNRLAGLGFGRHQSQGPITDKEVEIGGLLLPHVRRAVTISNLLDLRTIERSRMAEILDVLRCGVVLSDERGGILHANQSGLAELDRARLV